jgi:hypothetical protein
VEQSAELSVKFSVEPFGSADLAEVARDEQLVVAVEQAEACLARALYECLSPVPSKSYFCRPL